MARLAQSVERKALNLVVVGSSPTVGACTLGGFKKEDNKEAQKNKNVRMGWERGEGEGVKGEGGGEGWGVTEETAVQHLFLASASLCHVQLVQNGDMVKSSRRGPCAQPAILPLCLWLQG